MRKKNLYIQTFGCQMNVYDSERIARLLEEKNYQPVDKPEGADLIFINTCSVREKPEQKVYSAIGRFRRLKIENPNLILGVGGCVAQQEGEGLLNRFPYLDFVLGTKELSSLLRIVDDLENSSARFSATALEGRMDPYASLPLRAPKSKVSSFVTIMQGCDNFCTYCIVPFVRGREVSRPSGDILGEIRLLASSGVREVVLLGQNVNSYGQKSPGELSFPRLLEAIQEIPGIERIRFTTSHPKDLSPDLIAAFGRLHKLCEHIHLPLQSGSDPILRLMNRGYIGEEYARKVDALRQRCPDIAITTDFIVGFPGETEEDYAATLEMVHRIQFDEFFSFKYSDRPHTRASMVEPKVSEEISQRRLEGLQLLQSKITGQRNKRWERREVEVLVEGPSKSNAQEKTGRTRTHQTVNFPGKGLKAGSLAKIRITKAYDHSLRGEPLEKGGTAHD